MESFRDDDKLAEALGALRPAPSIAFAAVLDQRVAAGFPRTARSSTGSTARLLERLRALKPRRVLLPAAATAAAAIVAVTVVVAANQGSGGDSNATLGYANTQEQPPSGASARGDGELLGGFVPESAESADSATGTAAPSSSAAKAVPPADLEAMSGVGSSAAGGGARESVTGLHRDVERSTAIVLGTDPEGVADATAKVFEAVHAAHGIVLRSSSTNGSEGRAGASFDLLIPSGRLDDALAAFSGIAEVRSRHDGTVDITAPTVGASERLQDSQARIDSLLTELAGAETEAERAAIEAQVSSERRRSARLSAQLEALDKRASLSHVSLRIVADGSSSSAASGGSWDVGDALGDAGRILAIAAGVTIVGLAVLAPIALLALLIWAANRAWVRRERERALD